MKTLKEKQVTSLSELLKNAKKAEEYAHDHIMESINRMHLAEAEEEQRGI